MVQKLDRRGQVVAGRQSPDIFAVLFSFDLEGLVPASLPLFAPSATVPVPGSLVSARIILGIGSTNMPTDPLLAPSGTLNIWYGTYEDYPATSLMHPIDEPPLFENVFKVDLDITNWAHGVRARDVLSCSLTAISGVVLTLTLALEFRKTPVPVRTLLDEFGGSELETSTGEEIISE
jgi:hypothetical protein